MEPQTQTEAELPEVTIDDVAKLDLRFGKVIAADRVPKSDKLIKMQVFFGTFERKILAGVGKTFDPEQLLGGTFLFITNLPPRKIMGLESHGMMFASGAAPDGLNLVCSTGNAVDPVPPGTKIG